MVEEERRKEEVGRRRKKKVKLQNEEIRAPPLAFVCGPHADAKKIPKVLVTKCADRIGNILRLRILSIADTIVIMLLNIL
jgi:hypothetical protein